MKKKIIACRVRSETRRKIREEQDRQYEESLRADQMVIMIETLKLPVV